MLALETLSDLVHARAGGTRERPDIIRQSGGTRRDEIGQPESFVNVSMSADAWA